ncbi:MAG: geranylgeranylglyceryl/heptaprenylglyceryl phosphate synthase [Xanthomarina sp.]|nr:geranylgeranylglyceryl/heptaprenylglyceryl phosphate synthase [Xanthomarina sp.]MBF60781.1 geranylgeranylglyceryl/heptaprenylglyceryl phosphate synthase [Xanthomarina sp.]HAB28862.1 geranylgeranylglyceryl/heptaprenylglyceryl phosphate synthase [Xanthomarina gelatinilytica]HAI17635.1 geranylgeranylglyceryl/heptaprenylglyceryl phosphate synthase [Xanthomarina gelatinilytica]
MYQQIIKAISKSEKLLAVLIDPDKMTIKMASQFIGKINQSLATHIFVGGSTVADFATEQLVSVIKKHTHLPIILFPGDVSQITGQADALLFLSLISGRNPEYLIGKQVASVSKLRQMHLEVIPTGYLLIENGKETAVQKVTGTEPMSKDSVQDIVDTAKAGELLGMKLIYLEAGSGALNPIDSTIINNVKKEISLPLIVGGGIRTKKQLEEAYNSGADLVVIGTAFEDNEALFEELTSLSSRHLPKGEN